MAQKRKTSGKKKGSGTRKSSSSSSSRKNTSQPSRAVESNSNSSSFADYYHAFSKTRFFPPVAFIAVVTVLILLDLLFSWNDFDKFFKILGVELLIAGAIWIIGMVYSFSESTHSAGE